MKAAFSGLIARVALCAGALPSGEQSETELGSRLPHPAPAAIPLHGLSAADVGGAPGALVSAKSCGSVTA